MLTKRIIPCLDIKDDKVVKGLRFREHRVVGDILPLAAYYSAEGADELVMYDITASSDQRLICPNWINQVAANITIPFTAAGGIRSFEQARAVLNAGADKISMNSPVLENPNLITELAQSFGSQCIVIGIDSQWITDDYYVYQYTGDVSKTIKTKRKTKDWIKEVHDRGAGEIVLNCMNVDGVRAGYDIKQLQSMQDLCKVPLIASGGAGSIQDFVDLFLQTKVSGALAASVFHDKILRISEVKAALKAHNIEVRL